MPIIALLGCMIIIAFLVGWSVAIAEAWQRQYEGLMVMVYMTTAVILTVYYVGGP